MPHLAPQEQRTFFITSVCHARAPLFRDPERANLLIDVLHRNRKSNRFLLHAFIVMPDHFHALLTPAPDIPLEKAVQFIKGGFSFRAKRELDFKKEIWQPGFTEHRVKDAADFAHHRDYIHLNPVRANLCSSSSEYPFSSASAACAGLDPCPPWLKPKR